MKKTLSFLSSFLLILSSLSYGQSGDINEKMLKNIRTDYSKKAEHDKGIRNAVSNNDIKELSLNREISGKSEHNFKYKVNVKGITDQESSGRCWMFTGLNSLRPEIIQKQDLSSFEFSTNYLYFWDLFEKSNLFLEAIMDNYKKDFDDKTVEWLFKNPVGDGGVWNSFANIVTKYGVVPKSVMPETHHSENTAWLNRLLKRKLREDGLKLYNLKKMKTPTQQIETEKYNMMLDIYRMLVLFLGEPPVEFEYRFVNNSDEIGEYKEYTPKSFFKEFYPDFSIDNYVMLMNDPTREYYKVYEIQYDRNVLEGRNWIYLNLPSDEIKNFALESIKNNEAMYASCDVGKQLNKEDGTLDPNNYDFEALLEINFEMTKADRVKTFDSGSSHAMLLMAVDTDKDDIPNKWQFENSWGSSYGHNGYLTFTDAWFDEYMFRVVVNKEYINQETLELMNQESIILPPWDPMFKQDF